MTSENQTTENNPISDTLKVVELFAGIGAARKALKNLGVNHSSIISEIDERAARSYMAVHGDTPNLGNISDVEQLPECDLLTYGFPCQDISVAGHQRGFNKNSGTRSGLLWEVQRLLDCSPPPKIMILENVKAITGDKFRKPLNAYIQSLAERGYTSSWRVLNSRDFGIPQNRERFFMVSCLNGVHFQFPKGHTLKTCLKDFLQGDVTEKYYLSDAEIAKYEAEGIKSRMDKGVGCIEIGNLNLHNYRQADRVYDLNGLSPTLRTCQGGGLEVKIVDNTKKGYLTAKEGDGVILDHPTSTTKRGRVQQGMASTLMTCGGGVGVVVPPMLPNQPLRIRKLTEREYWRLMGFTDSDFDSAAIVTSKSQLYKQAGNSIVVQVLEAIFRELYMKKQPRMALLSDYCTEVLV